MNIKQLLKTLLPGLLPLFIFILADEIWGTEIGLWVAVIFGIFQLLIIYFKEKRFDKFVFFDTLLIVVLGLISILLNNEIFFKLKPAIVETILLAFLAISAFGSKNLLLMMAGRYMKGIEINDEAKNKMQKSIKLMFWIFLIHTILVYYSSFRMSKEAWAFISGVLFYLIFVLILIIEFIRTKLDFKKNIKDEILAEIDEKGNIIGKITRNIAHDGSKKLHPVIHVHIFNSRGELLLQKRHKNKLIQPGKWDTAVGGHIRFGESIDHALVRETKEELNLDNLKFNFLTKYIWESEIERELVFVFISVCDNICFKPNNEVEEVKFWKLSEIQKHINEKIFTPNFLNEFHKIIIKIKFNKLN